MGTFEAALPGERGGLEGCHPEEDVTEVIERMDSLPTWNVDHERHGLWPRLRAHLVPWVRRRARPPIEAEDVDGETVLRAIECLGQQPCRPWPVVWTWSTTTAMNLVFAAVRAERKVGLRYKAEVDHWAGREPPPTPSDVTYLSEGIWSLATPKERVFLRMASDGCSIGSIARVLGVSRSTVERLRRDLAQRVRASFGIRPDLDAVQHLSAWRHLAAMPAPPEGNHTC